MNFYAIALPLWKLVVVVFAALIAGIMNATSGGGSFITYPVLLSIGETSLVANATSTVGLWPGLVANLTGFTDEMRIQKRRIKIFIIPSIAGAILGSFILAHTSNAIFGFVAPVLIFIGALIMQFHKNVMNFFDRINLGTETRRLVVVTFAVFIICIYAAYFGAGVGILLIAIFSLLSIDNFVHMIAIKNVLGFCSNSVAALYFGFAGLIHWPVSLCMALGAIAGGIIGSRLVHKINKDIMRKYTVILGFSISTILLIIRLINL